MRRDAGLVVRVEVVAIVEPGEDVGRTAASWLSANGSVTRISYWYMPRVIGHLAPEPLRFAYRKW